MPTIDMTERDLRNAMQDPRYWQAGHPEREDYAPIASGRSVFLEAIAP